MDFTSDNATTAPESLAYIRPTYALVIWGIVDFTLVICILGGNILTICAVKLSRKLSAVLSNQFIFSLALSDIMVGVCFPYHYAFFIVVTLEKQRDLCLLRFVFTILACSSSISNLLGIAMDRYIAIVYPLHYSRYMTKKIAFIIIVSTWIAALGACCVPIFWNAWTEGTECMLLKVLPSEFVNFVIIPMFASVWISMSVIYLRIWREATDHAQRLKTTTSYQFRKTSNDTKSVQVVLLILGGFSICWLPFFLIVIVMKVESWIVYELTLRMAIANSGMNPIIYAWKNYNFRKIFWCLLRFKTPNNANVMNSFITNYVPRVKKIENHEIPYDQDVYVVKNCDIEIELQYNNLSLPNERECSVGTASTSAASLTRT